MQFQAQFGLQLYSWHYIYNLIFKMKHKLYSASQSANIPPPTHTHTHWKILHVDLAVHEINEFFWLFSLKGSFPNKLSDMIGL